MILSEKIKLIPIDASTEPDIDGITYRIDAIAWTWRELVMRVGTYDLVEPDGYEYDATLRRLSTGAPGEIKKWYSFLVPERLHREAYEQFLLLVERMPSTAPTLGNLDWFLCVEEAAPEATYCYAWRMECIYEDAEYDDLYGIGEGCNEEGRRDALVVVRVPSETETLTALTHWMRARARKEY